MELIHLRRIEATDQSLAVEHLRKSGVTIGGIATDSLYRALCVSPQVCKVLAKAGGAITGIALVEVDRAWLWHKPFLLGHMVLARLLNRLRDSRANSSKQLPCSQELPLFVSREIPPLLWLSWSTPVPRVLFISVEPNWQGRGIAKELYLSMFEEVRAAGHSHILARILRSNTASLYLHRATGWDLYEDGDAVLAVKALAAS